MADEIAVGSVSDATGQTIRTLDGTKVAGLNRVNWNLAPTPPAGGRQGGGGGGRGGFAASQPGAYTVTLTVGGKSLSKPLSLLEDCWLREQ